METGQPIPGPPRAPPPVSFSGLNGISDTNVVNLLQKSDEDLIDGSDESLCGSPIDRLDVVDGEALDDSTKSRSCRGEDDRWVRKDLWYLGM